MSTRQRLRSGLQISRPQTICWRCSLKQQRWRSSSATVSALDPLDPDDSLPPFRIPKHVLSPARRCVDHHTTRSHLGLPQNDMLATTSSTCGDLGGERRSSWSNQKTQLPPRPTGIGPAIATPLAQHVLSKKLPMLTVMVPPLPRSRKSPYTCSAVGRLHFAVFIDMVLIEAAKLCNRTDPVGATS